MPKCRIRTLTCRKRNIIYKCFFNYSQLGDYGTMETDFVSQSGQIVEKYVLQCRVTTTKINLEVLKI